MRASLTSFVDYNNTVGPSRTRLPGVVRAMHEDPARHPWAYYGPWISAFCKGFGDLDHLRQCLSGAMDDAERRAGQPWCQGQMRHYGELVAGAMELRRAKKAVTAVDSSPSLRWRWADLEVTVSPHLAVDQKRGPREAWFLYVKERPLEQGTADPALVIMTEVLRDAGLDWRPRVVDVRRAKTYVLTANRSQQQLREHVVAEAEQFARLWERAA